MSIRHHLTDQLLMAYAAGDLPEAFNLVVATHVSLCDECRARLASYEAVGGAMLEGADVAEMSDAAGTSWLDTGKRDWSDDLLAATGLSRAQMPRLVEGSAVSGQLRDTLAARWGLPKGVVVAGGGGDNAASGIGVGVVRAGDAFVSLGTSGVLFAANDGYQPAPDRKSVV